MAVYSAAELTKTTLVTKAVRRTRTRNTHFQELFGVMTGNPKNPDVMNPGPNIGQRPGREFAWDLYDVSRRPSTVRAVGQPPGTQSKRVFGHATGTAIRVHTSIPILSEDLYRTRPLGGQWGSAGVDANGQTHLRRNQQTLAEEDRNLREFAISRMCRGQFYLHQVGDDWFVSDASSLTDGTSLVTVDYQIPAGNKSKLDMTDVDGTSIYGGDIIDASWATIATTDIPAHLDKIKAAMEVQHNRSLKDILINQATWQYVRTNAKIIALAGSANTPVATYYPRQGSLAQPGSMPDAGYIAVLTGLPMYRWHVYDSVLEVFDGTAGSFPNSAFVPDNIAIFMPPVDSDWFEFIEGSEPIRESLTVPERVVYGLSVYSRPTIEPTGVRLTSVDNFLPILYNPFCICYGTVIF